MGKTIKITLEQARQEFIKREYNPLFNIYINNMEKLLAETKEGYKIVISLNKLKLGREPSIFGNDNPYTIENLRLYLVINKINLKLISTEYKNNLSKLVFITPEGYKITSTWNGLDHQHTIVDLRNPYSVENIKLWLKNHNLNFELLTEKYDGKKLELITNEGYKVIIKWASLQTGDIPDLFSIHNPYTLENIRLWLKNTNSKNTLVSTEYKCIEEKLTFNCPKHGNYSIIWSIHKHNCKQCTIENNSGVNNHMWKGGISTVYEYLRRKIIQWKKDSMKDCNYKCVLTGKRFEVIHHLYGFDKILKETLEICNLPIHNEINKYSQDELKLLESICNQLHYKYGLGVCLSDEIHDLFHKENGYGDNYPEQFEKFKIRYKSGEFDEYIKSNSSLPTAI